MDANQTLPGNNALISILFTFLVDHAVWLMAISMVSLFAGLVLLPVFVTRIPVDYFSHPQRQRLSARSRYPLTRLLIAGAKNLLGALLVFAGFLMLFLPGQGLLTLLVGLMIMNYPGKFALERWLIQRPLVLPAMNWLRARYNHLPLQAPGVRGIKGGANTASANKGKIK